MLVFPPSGTRGRIRTPKLAQTSALKEVSFSSMSPPAPGSPELGRGLTQTQSGREAGAAK